MKKIKYIIADDHAVFRQGVKYSISGDDGIECAGEANNGNELLMLLDTQPSDVILMDLKMPEMDGIMATQKVRNLYPDIKIVILTMHDDEEYIIHMLDNGANGYLVKNAEPTEIIDAIYSAHETGYYFNEMVSKIMLKVLMDKKKINPLFKKFEELDDREKEIIRLICEEHTTAEIAKEIYLSQRTVEGLRTGILKKIGVRNTAGIVLYAIKNGIYNVV